MRVSSPATLATPETKHICAVPILLSVSPEPEEGLLLPSPNWYHFWSSLLVCLP